jgi:hypothetical protein
MSEHSAIRAASLALAHRVRQGLLADPELALLFNAAHVVSLETPKEMRATTPKKVGLSVWLYRVQRNEFTANRPRERPAPDRLRRAPLPVNLHYLMTPLSGNPENEQAIMGKLLQVLHDQPFVQPSPTYPDLLDVLRVTLEDLDVESTTRIWNALDEPYQLSTSYEVQVVNIRSGQEPAVAPPVIRRVSEYNQIVRVR